ncbi:MAG: histidinol-phosphate transaminase [Deltaproteobacteria bacterium]|nr:histidinol-phosphate transaminase [Deltaproteobacteria bacterium]
MASFEGGPRDLAERRRRGESRVLLGPRVGSTIEALRPFSPPKPILAEAAERGFDSSEILHLAANESPLGPSPLAVASALHAVQTSHRFPDVAAPALRRAIADRHLVDPEEVVVGNGSSELIELLVRTFVGPNEAIAAVWPSFVVYRQAAQAQGRDAFLAPLIDDCVDLDALATVCRAETKLCFLASPNNPTGTIVGHVALEAFMERIPRSTIVVLDEAYHEFVSDPGAADGMTLRAAYRDQVVVLRTFSKAYGLAGLRVGYGVMSKDLAGYVHRVRQPYNVSSVGQAAALAALKDQAHVDETRRVVLEGRDQLEDGFVSLGLAHVPSQASFVVVRLPIAASEVERALAARGIFVRALDGYGMPEALRVAVGLPEANARFLDALAEVLAVRAGAA